MKRLSGGPVTLLDVWLRSKPKRNPLAEENQKLKAKVAHLEKNIHQAIQVCSVGM